MLCPKCKTELKKETLRCTNCGVRVRTRCPICGALNRVTALNCVSCAQELLRKCPSCGAYNLPTSNVCRKCSNPIGAVNQISEPVKSQAKPVLEAAIKKETAQVVPPPIKKVEDVSTIEETKQEQINLQPVVDEIADSPIDNNSVVSDKKNDAEPKETTLEEDENFVNEEDFSSQTVSDEVPVDEQGQMEVKTSIVNALMNSENKFCALIAPEGYGKTHVLSAIKEDLNNAKVAFLSSLATPISQLSPFGVFQDLFINLCGVPDFFIDGQQKESVVEKVLEQSLGIPSDEAYSLFSLLYPSKTSYYEEILHNNIATKTLIKKIISHIKTLGESVIVIDNFDLIDATSFELLGEMFKEGYFDDNLKLLVAVQSQKNIDAFMQLTQMDAEFSGRFYMAKFTDDEIKSYVYGLLNNSFPFSDEFLEKIVQAAKGSPYYVGQLLLYMNDINMFVMQDGVLSFNGDEETFEFPIDSASIVAKRLENIKQQLPVVYKALICIAMLGEKFNVLMLQAALGIEQQPFQDLYQALNSLVFVSPVSESTLQVQSSGLWRNLYDILRKDEMFAQCCAELLPKIVPLRVTNVAYKPLMAQNSGDEQGAFDAWSQVMRLSANLGDINLYVLAQKQCLKLNENLAMELKDKIDTNIKSRLSRLLCESEPELALEFLTTILSLDFELENNIDFIDMASYAVLAANKAGNYNAVIEIVDKVVAILQPPEKYKLEIALINARKIKTMLYLGNFEQLINIIENDIKPQLEDALSQNYTVYNLPISKIFETWVETNFVLADAYILQGSNKVYNVISDLEEAISSHEDEFGEFAYKLKLTKAFVSVMKGEVVEADRLMEEISSNVANVPIDNDYACKFNLIQALNRFMKKDFSNMRTYLYEVVTFANNNGDNLSKNLLKSALGKLLENEGDFSKAFEIYNDEIMYFAKERIAVGALLTWYLIADLHLKVSDVDKALEYAVKALDVAKNPRINSFYFQVMYKRLIAEIYLLKGDFDATKMYLEKAMLITKKFNLEYLNVLLYDCYAKYHIELFKAGQETGSAPLASAKKLYEKAINLASRLGVMKLVDELKHEYQSLMTFAQLKKISLG